MHSSNMNEHGLVESETTLFKCFTHMDMDGVLAGYCLPGWPSKTWDPKKEFGSTGG